MMEPNSIINIVNELQGIERAINILTVIFSLGFIALIIMMRYIMSK